MRLHPSLKVSSPIVQSDIISDYDLADLHLLDDEETEFEVYEVWEGDSPLPKDRPLKVYH